MLLFVTLCSIAQEKTITGTVVDETNMPLPGATVVIKGTTTGTSTDFDGLYSIQANVGDILVFSYVGYADQENTVGSSPIINVSLALDNSLECVVVTALGIKRKSSSSTPSYKFKSDEIKYGQLTAKELNDFKYWKDWISVYKNEIPNTFKDKWGFDFTNMLNVNVTHLKEKISNVEVRLYNSNNELITKTTTNSFGEAKMFRGANEECLVQVIVDNNVYGKRVRLNMNDICINIDEELPQNNDLDIMFTIDATGSMQDEIDYLKVELKNIIKRISDKQTTRVGLTFYRDNGDEYVVKDFDFNNNIVQVQKELSKQNARGEKITQKH